MLCNPKCVFKPLSLEKVQTDAKMKLLLRIDKLEKKLLEFFLLERVFYKSNLEFFSTSKLDILW